MTEKLSYAGCDLEAMAEAPNYYRWLIAQTRPFLGSDVIEIGAGCGNFSKYLLEEKPMSLRSIEPSPEMAPLLHANSNQSSQWYPFSGYLEDHVDTFKNSADSLVYINVMEHIEKDEEEIELAKNCLRPGGHLIIYVPALPFLYSEFDRSIGHFRRYKKAELIGKTEKAGLKVLQCRYCDFPGIPVWYLRFTLLKGKLNARQVALYDRYAFPLISAMESKITPPIGKNLLLIATTGDTK